VLSFSVYNALAGYLLLRGTDEGLQNPLLSGFALTLRSVVNDYGLREDHEEDYDRVGRWVLTATIFLGS
jgi:hypothetical protein